MALDDISLDEALAGVLTDDKAGEEDAATAEHAAPEQATEQAAEQEPTGETDASPASDQTTNVPLKAYEAERQKRQAAERRLAELERQQATPAHTPDPLEDPDGFSRHLNEAVMRETQRLRVETQQELMRARHDDYDEKEAKFLEMAQDNPALLTQATASGNVAKFAYETVVKAEKFAEMQDVDGYEAKLRQRIEAVRAKLEAEHKATQAKLAELEAATSLPSLATVGYSGAADVDLDLASIIGADPTKRRRR